MSARDEVQVLVDHFCQEHGFRKKSGSWYRTQDQTIAVLNLQRSQYSHEYYLNAALWLLDLDEADAPKEHHCHVRTRVNRLVEDTAALMRALDLERGHDDNRGAVLIHALTVVDDLLRACATVEGCLSPPGKAFIDRSLVRREAQELLAGGS